MPALIAFDLDDTLYRERDYVASGQRAVAEAIAPYAGTEPGVLEKIMQTSDDAFEALEQAITPTAAKTMFPVSRMVEIYRFHKPSISPDAGVTQVLEALVRRGNRLAVITDGNAVRQHAKISALGLDRFFPPENVIIGTDSSSDKNTPVPFAAAEALAPGLRHIYVGDNTAKDFHWPNIRGWLTIMLRDSRRLNIHPQNPSGVPPACRPAMTVDSVSALIQLTN